MLTRVGWMLRTCLCRRHSTPSAIGCSPIDLERNRGGCCPACASGETATPGAIATLRGSSFLDKPSRNTRDPGAERAARGLRTCCMRRQEPGKAQAKICSKGPPHTMRRRMSGMSITPVERTTRYGETRCSAVRRNRMRHDTVRYGIAWVTG